MLTGAWCDRAKYVNRLTYNCAHLRLTKESLTIFWVKIIWLKIFLSENFLGEYFWVKIYFGLKFWGVTGLTGVTEVTGVTGRAARIVAALQPGCKEMKRE